MFKRLLLGSLLTECMFIRLPEMDQSKWKENTPWCSERA